MCFGGLARSRLVSETDVAAAELSSTTMPEGGEEEREEVRACVRACMRAER